METDYSRAESDRRIAAGICCSASYADRTRTRTVFKCSNPVKPGNGICRSCDEAQENEEGRCDGLAAARHDHQRDE